MSETRMEYHAEDFTVGGHPPFNAGLLTLAENLNRIASTGWALVTLFRQPGPALDQWSYQSVWQRRDPYN